MAAGLLSNRYCSITMTLSDQLKRNWLSKKLRQGFRGYPIVTLAHYGPTDKLATKIAIGFARSEDEDPDIVERLFSKDDSTDIRTDETHKRIAEIAKELGTRSVVTVDLIIGCPHEEGIDYPEGKACPQCPFWANRDRWTGDLVH